VQARKTFLTKRIRSPFKAHVEPKTRRTSTVPDYQPQVPRPASECTRGVTSLTGPVQA
jgi:hypothetical protein